MIDRFRSSRFARATLALAGGTAISQAILMLAMPVLTRMYSPEDFRLAAIYISIVAIIGTIACLRLEIAIMLPDFDEDAAALLVLCLILAVVSAVIVGLLLALPQLASISALQRLAASKWLIPIGVWLIGSFAALQYWGTRMKRFSLVARTRILQAVSGVAVQLGLGVGSAAASGLIVGHVFFSGAGALGFVRALAGADGHLIRHVRVTRMLELLKTYRRFPMYSTLEALANVAGNNLPILVIASIVPGAEAAFLFLASRVLGAPMQLVGSAVGDVYLADAAERLRRGELHSHTLSVLRVLATIGIVPLVLVAIGAPYLFAAVFGPEWRRAGELVQWMAPWFLLQFLASPVSMGLHVLAKQSVALSLQFTGMVLRLGSILVAHRWLPGREAEAYAVSGGVFYAIFLVVILTVLARNKADSMRLVQPGDPIAAG